MLTSIDTLRGPCNEMTELKNVAECSPGECVTTHPKHMSACDAHMSELWLMSGQPRCRYSVRAVLDS
jgi:hypothetical protein